MRVDGIRKGRSVKVLLYLQYSVALGWDYLKGLYLRVQGFCMVIVCLEELKTFRTYNIVNLIALKVNRINNFVFT